MIKRESRPCKPKSGTSTACLAPPYWKSAKEVAMSTNELVINQATEILLQKFAKPTDIAWAWEMLGRREYKNDEEKYKAILCLTRFIEGLNLPTRCANGLPSLQLKGVPVAGEDIRESQYVLVDAVKRLAIESEYEWATLPTSNKTMQTKPVMHTLEEPNGKSEERTEKELVELFHKSNRKGSTGLTKKSQRDLAEEYGIGQTRIGQLLDKAEILIEKENPKTIDSVWHGGKRQVIKDGKRS